MSNALRDLLESAARGRHPPPDGTVRLLPSPPGPVHAVMAFTAHALIAADVTSRWVAEHVPAGDLTGPLRPDALAALAAELRTVPGSVDVVLAAPALDPGPGDLLRPLDTSDHERSRRAHRYRSDVRVYSVASQGVLNLGRGLADRSEVSFELAPEARGHGLGRAALLAARGLVDPGEHLFAAVAPGNARSLRSLLSAGFVPIGAEALLLKEPGLGRGP